MVKLLNHNQFITKLRKKNKHFKNDEFEILGKYKGSKNKILVRNKYGKCLSNVCNLINGCNISIRTAINKTEYFINQAREIHGNKYDYNLVKYKNNETKIRIICKCDNLFHMSPGNHLKGRGCSKCLIKSTTITFEKFIKKAKEVHGDKYDYSLVYWINAKTKIKIICPKNNHETFEQIPNSHLLGHGCKKCGSLIQQYCQNNKFNIKNVKDFIEKANEIHNFKYDYDLVKFKTLSDKIIIKCSNHLLFKQRVRAHLNGHGCKKCSIEKNKIINIVSFEIFKKRIPKNILKNIKLFEETYVNLTTKMKIQCLICNNIFYNTPHKYLQTSGCAFCSRQKSSFSKAGFKSIVKNRNAILYLIKCWNENEEFYKIGITSRSIKERYETTTQMPYEYEILYEQVNNAEFIYDLERSIFKKYKDFKYIPEIKFGGYTECFKLESNINKMLYE